MVIICSSITVKIQKKPPQEIINTESSNSMKLNNILKNKQDY